MNPKIKYIIIAVIAIVVIVLAFTVGGNSNENVTDIELSNDPEVIMSNATEESTEASQASKKDFIQIDTNTYLEYKAGSEAKTILLARPTCHYCQIAEPIIQNIAYEYNIDIHYLNTDNFTEEDQAAFINSDEEFSGGYGTPFLFVVKDGQIIDSVDGLTDKAHYLYFFSTNGYI